MLRPGRLATDIRRRWNRLGMSARFAIVTTVILFSGMFIVGEWAARRVEESIIHSHAASAVLFTDSFVASHVQDLKSQSSLSPEVFKKLDPLFSPLVTGKPIVGFRIWKQNTIVYAERRDLIGLSHAASAARTRALAGAVGAVYRFAGKEHSSPQVQSGERLLEIYAPIREIGTDRVIALAETYEIAASLQSEIDAARIGSWQLIAAIGAGMLLTQVLIVQKTSRTIKEQRNTLNLRIADLSRMLAENTSLRHANVAGVRVSELTERYLRQIGAEVHDGPLQVISIAMLRLDSLNGLVDSRDEDQLREASEDILVIRDTLRDSIQELRNIAAGLALPEIDHQSLSQVIRTAVDRHERHCGMAVACDVNKAMPEVQTAIKVCLYRFIQEGLSNAFRHAHGKGQSVIGRVSGESIEISVLDDGLVWNGSLQTKDRQGQGLIGLRDRVHSLGGDFSIVNRPEGGTRLTARFQISDAALTDDLST